MDYLRISEKEAKSELQQRIELCNEVVDKLKKGCKSYDSNRGLTIFLIIVLSIIAGGIAVFAPKILSYGIKLAASIDIFQGIWNYSQYFYLSLYSIVAYLGLYILRKYLTLKKVEKINTSIKKVSKVEKYLSSNLENIDKLTEEIEARINNSEDVNPFSAIGNIDNDLNDYEEMANAYIDDSDSLLDVLANGMYWISTLAFGASFIFVFICRLSYRVNWHKPHDILPIVMAAFIGVGLIGVINIHKYLKKKNKNKGIGSYTLSLLCGPVAYPVVIGAYYLVALAISALIVLIVIAVIVAIIVGLFNS